MSNISFGPIDAGPMHMSRSMSIRGTRAWLVLRPHERKADGSQHPIMRALRHGETVTPLELGALIPGLAAAEWKRAGGFASDIAKELVTQIDNLQMNLVLAASDAQKLPWDVAEIELRDAAERLSAELGSPSDAAAEIWTVTAGDRAFTVFVRADHGWWASETLRMEQPRRVSAVVTAEGPSDNVEAAVLKWARDIHSTVQIRRH